MIRFAKIFGSIIFILTACIIIRQVINSQTGYNIPFFRFETFYDYLKGFNGSIITDNIEQAFATIQSFLNSFNNFGFIDAITAIPRLLFMLFDLVLAVIRIGFGLIYFIYYMLGFIPYLFKGYI